MVRLSKHNQQRQPQPQPVAQPEAQQKLVPDYKRCPLCFGGRGGIGRQYGQYDAKQLHYLRCNQCGHTWTAEVHTVGVVVDARIPRDVQTR